MSSGLYKKRTSEKADVCQYSIDIVDCDELNATAVIKALQAAGFTVAGCEWQERWTAEDYGFMYGEEDE